MLLGITLVILIQSIPEILMNLKLGWYLFSLLPPANLMVSIISIAYEKPDDSEFKDLYWYLRSYQHKCYDLALEFRIISESLSQKTLSISLMYECSSTLDHFMYKILTAARNSTDIKDLATGKVVYLHNLSCHLNLCWCHCYNWQLKPWHISRFILL